MQLPTTLSDLLELAHAELKRLEVGGVYFWEEGSWHDPKKDGRCGIDLAGAIMATLVNDPTKEAYEDDFPKPLRQRFLALDALQAGSTFRAGTLFKQAIKPEGHYFDVRILEGAKTPYIVAKDHAVRDASIIEAIRILRGLGA